MTTMMLSASNNNSGSTEPEYVLRDGADLLYYNTTINASQRVFGQPGASLHHANIDDIDALQAGIRGEQKVAAELEKLAAQYPNTYVFHSIKRPGSIGDMDHVIVQENRALLIDTKNWRQNATYALALVEEDNEGDIILRDGEVFPGGSIKLRRQLVDWQMLFIQSDVTMHAALVIANTNSVVEQHVETGYDFMNITGLKNLFSNVFNAEEAAPLSDEMLRYYANLVQNPNFDPNDLENYIAVYPAAAYYKTPVKRPATTMSKWLVAWSVLNYILMPIVFPVAGLSAIPLIFITHRHKATIRQQQLGGKGLLTAVLIFSYFLLAIWLLMVAVVAVYYLTLPGQIETITGG